MALLSVRLLGGFQVDLDGSAVTGFSTDKARALLAFLATESGRPHRRQALAGLLWPDFPERSARTSLRTALANLRQAIGDHQAAPPFLQISRQAVTVNPNSAIWVDVTVMGSLLNALRTPQPAIAGLEDAIDLYRGEFLEGFSLADSAPFDDWVLMTRAQLRNQVTAALGWLAAVYQEQGEPHEALRCAGKWVELEPWHESARRELMRLLAATGRRSDALSQYHVCQQFLADDLGVEPEAETTSLYQDILGGKLGEVAGSHCWPLVARRSLPSFLTEVPKREIEKPVFVGRERELERLCAHLHLAMGGCEQVVFVVGGAGRGKTALLEEFATRVQSEHHVVVTTGYCNAYSGSGDPYLPFRQILRALTGDVDDLWAAGRVTKEHATQLWEVLPTTAQATVEVGADLIETFLDGAALLERAVAAAGGDAPWLPRLCRLVQARTASQGVAGLKQRTLIDEYAGVLQRVAQDHPLIIILEDLHWVDRGSIELLLHIGRSLARSRIMVVGAYRPDEIAAWRGTGDHSLDEAVAELRSLYGEIVIDLALEGPTESWRFVNDLLDAEPNRLSDSFRRELHRHTAGHPLFSVEMLRMLQERGDLQRDPEGRWVDKQSIAWDAVPARVEAVIQKRVSRLEPLSHEYLTVASVEGEDFTAEVIARVLNRPERQVLHALAQDLGRNHRLLQERGEFKTRSQSVSRFRFSHHLIQRHVYNSLSTGERRRLHAKVAVALEALYAHEIEAVTIPLAYHYGQTAMRDRALHYLAEAGHQARRRYDGQQAVEYLSEALALVPDDSPDQFRLLAARASVQDFLAQRSTQKADLDAMEALAARLGDRGLQCDAQLALCDFYLSTEAFRARKPAQRARAIAQEIDDGVREAQALRRLSWEGRLGADLQTSRIYLQKAVARFREAGLPGEAASCLFMLARRLPMSGKQVFALEPAEEAMALSRESGDHRLQAVAQRHLAIAHMNLDRDEQAWPLAQAAMETQRDLGDRREQCSTMDVLGVILARLGRRDEAAAMFHRCLALSEEIGCDWGILGAVFGILTYQYPPEGEYGALLTLVDERLRLASGAGHHWLCGFLSWVKTRTFMDLGLYDRALSMMEAAASPVPVDKDPVSHVGVLQDTGSIKANLGRQGEARRDLEQAVQLAETTSDRYLLGGALVRLAELALVEGSETLLGEGLKQVRQAMDAAMEVRDEILLAKGLDVSARLRLALGRIEGALDDSSRAMQLFKACPWLPMPQTHLQTHSSVLRAHDRREEAVDCLRAAHERVLFVASKLTDDSLRQSWLRSVRVNREIAEDWSGLPMGWKDAGQRMEAAA